MSPNTPVPSGQRQEDSSIASALRHCLETGLVIVDTEASTVTLTPRAEAMLGLAGASGASRPAATLPESLLDLAREVMTLGAPATDRELELALPQERTVQVRVNAVPVRCAGSTGFVMLALSDLTPAARCEQQLRELDRLANLGTLAASSAHEVRNALVASKTFIDLLLEKNQDAELANIVRREIGRMESIIRGLLKFAGPPAQVPGPLHLHAVLEYCLHLVQPQLAGRSISLERSFRAAPDLAQGDELALQQVFMNLLLNGYEAINGEGTLTVGTESGSSQLRVTIQDTGGGIRPENLPHLFEPFFTTKPGGTGLGLAISHRIIQQHQGAIAVSSTPGEGTIFTVTLPALANGS